MGYIAAFLIGLGVLAFLFYLIVTARAAFKPGIAFRWRVAGAVAVSMAFLFGGVGWLFTQKDGAMGLPLVLPLAIVAGILASWGLLSTKDPRRESARRRGQE